MSDPYREWLNDMRRLRYRTDEAYRLRRREWSRLWIAKKRAEARAEKAQ